MPWIEVALAKPLPVVATALQGFRPPPPFLEVAEGLKSAMASNQMAQMAYRIQRGHLLMSFSRSHNFVPCASDMNI